MPDLTRAVILTEKEQDLILFFLPSVADVNDFLPAYAAGDLLALLRKFTQADDSPSVS